MLTYLPRQIHLLCSRQGRLRVVTPLIEGRVRPAAVDAQANLDGGQGFVRQLGGVERGEQPLGRLTGQHTARARRCEAFAREQRVHVALRAWERRNDGSEKSWE